MRRTIVLGGLLAFVATLQFGYPITTYGQGWTAAYMVLYAMMLGIGIVSVRADGEVVAPMIIVTTSFLVTGTWFSLAQDSTTATVAMLITVALSMAALVFALMRFVFRRRQAPGIDLVLAAISAYLVIGGFFAAALTLVEIAAPGSFVDSEAATFTWQQMLYYSYVSLATLGYGDILPVSPWARSLGSLAAVLGTLYLTVVVARLVGIWSSNGPTDTT